MPSVEACLTWATPVEIDALGSSLEAYCNLQQTIITLRLCNVFGRGDKAAITRLPVELVREVEDCLMYEERDLTREAWAADYRCFTMQCQPIDHFGKAERQGLYEIAFPEEFDQSDAEAEGETQVTELTAHELEALAKALKDDDNENLLDCCLEWESSHGVRKEGWYARVGNPSAEDRGFFSKHNGLLAKHFGLKVWISHSRELTADQELRRSTLAYLVLPESARTSSTYKQRWEDEDQEFMQGDNYWGGGYHREPTESGFGTTVAMPYKPSDHSLSRFGRATTMLSLKPVTPKQPTLFASAGDAGGSGEEGVAGAGCASWPALTFLIAGSDEGED